MMRMDFRSIRLGIFSLASGYFNFIGFRLPEKYCCSVATSILWFIVGYQASLRLAALSLTLSHGRGDKVVAAQSVSGFDKRWGLTNIDFAYPLQHFLQSAPSPAGEGWGEGLAELK